MQKIGIITYACPHLKTEQLILSLLNHTSSYKVTLKIFALPFLQRKNREILFNHRPNQANSISPDILCKAYGIEYIKCLSDTDIDNSCDVFLIAGANILSDTKNIYISN